MNVKYINPFVTASKKVLQQLINIDPIAETPKLMDTQITGSDVVVIIGLTGEIKGQVMFAMSENTALNLARKMTYNNSLKELDYISESAISEVGNMISGSTGMEMFSQGININITPPSLCRGGGLMVSSKNKFVSIPLNLSDYGKLFLNISFEEV